MSAPTPAQLVEFAKIAADVASLSSQSYGAVLQALVEASGLLVEAERRGAEKAWDEGFWFRPNARLVDPEAFAKANPNPYRADIAARGES